MRASQIPRRQLARDPPNRMPRHMPIMHAPTMPHLRHRTRLIPRRIQQLRHRHVEHLIHLLQRPRRQRHRIRIPHHAHVRAHKHPLERQKIREMPKHLHLARLKPHLLERLPQRRLTRRLPRLQPAPRKTHLPRMRPQRTRPPRKQQLRPQRIRRLRQRQQHRRHATLRAAHIRLRHRLLPKRRPNRSPRSARHQHDTGHPTGMKERGSGTRNLDRSRTTQHTNPHDNPNAYARNAG